MNKYRLKSLAVVGALLLVFCGSNYTLLNRAESSKVAELKAYSEQRGAESAAVQKADSLSRFAVSLKEKGAEEDAWWANRQAFIYYRLALTEYDLAQSEKVITALKKDLLDTQQQLKTYQEVLSELEHTRAP